MNEHAVLNAVRLPARLDVACTARVLGFEPHDIAVLIKSKVLVPLGRPAPNATKYFAASEILKLAEDPAFLSRATTLIYRYHQVRNSKHKEHDDH